MKTVYTLVAALAFSGMSYQAQAQLKIKSDSGKMILGPDMTVPNHVPDAMNVLSGHIFGKQGSFRAGSKLAFGDFGRYDFHSWNVFVGEYWNPQDMYADPDTDQLWLHGKYGMRLTYGRGDNNQTIGYYSVDEGNRFNFNCGVRAQEFLLQSDGRYKTNVKKLDGALGALKKLDGVSYDFLSEQTGASSFSQSSVATDATGGGGPTAKETRDIAFFTGLEQQQKQAKKQLGFIAQDIQKVFPELVEANAEGYLHVNYIGIIPVLVEALKEQQAMLEEQNRKISGLEKSLANGQGTSGIQGGSSSGNLVSGPAASGVVLYQNVPNPFTNETEIRYFLPIETREASLCIFDMQGKLLKTISLTSRGEGTVTISATEFSAGLYLYSLIADGKEVDTKRMLLNR